MASMKPLGTLINDAIKFTQTHLVVLVVGAVVFGFLTQGVGWWMAGSAGMGMGKDLGAWQNQMESVGKQMEALQQKAANGGLDEASQKQMEELGKQMAEQSMQGASMMGGVFLSMLPAIGLALLLTIVISLFAKSYFLVVAVKGMSDPATALQATVMWLLPLVGLWIWLALRTFIWIPFIGLIIAIILGPRFILAPLYLLEHNKGAMESARMSYSKTKGYWGKIFGNALLFGIVTMVCAGILSKIFVGVLGLMAGGFLAAVISEFAGAMLVVFSMQLARTVMENSRA